MTTYLILFICFLILVLAEACDLVLILWLILSFVFLLVLSENSTSPSSLSSALVFLLSLVVAVFLVTTSLFIFFLMYELSLVPVCLMIAIFGYQPEKLSAVLWLMLYTVVCSAPFLYFSLVNYHSVCFGLSALTPFASFLVCLSFIVKAPLYTLHSWLPKAHVEAPLFGSMLLAGVMLKLGSYGFLLAAPSLSTPCVLFLYYSVAGGVVCSLICFRAWDLKSLVAYSSIVHIGVVTICVLSCTELGFIAAIWIVVSHSLLSPLMFILSNEYYTQTGSRAFFFGHCTSFSPGTLFIISVCSGLSFGLPPFIAFWVELAMYVCISSYCSLLIFPLALASFLTFLYSLCFYVFSSGGPNSALPSLTSSFYTYLPALSFSLLIITF